VPLLTVQEVAHILRRKIGRIYAYLEEGAFPNARKLNGGWLIPELDVTASLDRAAGLRYGMGHRMQESQSGWENPARFQTLPRPRTW
jgi:hypothetical protein